jgi:hypothetical protein
MAAAKMLMRIWIDGIARFERETRARASLALKWRRHLCERIQL